LKYCHPALFIGMRNKNIVTQLLDIHHARRFSGRQGRIRTQNQLDEEFLQATIHQGILRKLRQLPFPSPPFDGIDTEELKIEPIETGFAMLMTGYALKNCLAGTPALDYAIKIHLGELFLYDFWVKHPGSSKPFRGAVAIRQTLPDLWQVDETTERKSLTALQYLDQIRLINWLGNAKKRN
jgi:hypothetical protein